MKITGELIAALVSALVGFLAGTTLGWYLLIAPSDGPKGFFHSSNIEILLICGVIPAVLSAGLSLLLMRVLARKNDQDWS
jgi:uncharacterized membrane protein